MKNLFTQAMPGDVRERMFQALIAATALTTYVCFDYRSLQSISPPSIYIPLSVRPIPQHLLDQARQRAQQFNATQAIDEVSILITNHPAFQNIPKEYQPDPSWTKWHFPDLSIAGLQKAGSSQLYKMLTTHKEMTRFHRKQKEFPFGIPHLSMNVSNMLLQGTSNTNEIIRQEQIISIQQFYHDRNKHPSFQMLSMNHQATKTNSSEETAQHSPRKQRLTVNGHLDTATVTMMRQYLDRTKDSKLILMVRDPADWLWSAYNFWLLPQHNDMQEAQRADWAASPAQYRSPELFHEMLLAGSDRFGPTAELIGKMRDRIANLFSRVIASAAMADKSMVMVMKTEDMTPDRINSSGLLSNMADFLGVSLDGFNATVVESFSNCGNKRGIDSTCTKSSSAYSIAGNRPMLEESRDLVYLYFAEECKLWAKQFGIVYERCLQVSEQY